MQIAWFHGRVARILSPATLRKLVSWRARTFFALAVAGALSASNASAQAVAQMAGAWEGATLAAPVEFYESYYNHETKTVRMGATSTDFNRTNETLAEIHFYHDFEGFPEVINIARSGAFSGTGSGTITLPGVGLVEALTPERVYGHFAVSNDLMVFLTREPRGSQDLTFLLRKPSSTALADLAGRWNASSFSMPKAVHRVYYNHLTQRARHSSSRNDWARTNETLADIYLPSPWEAGNFAFNVNSAGAISEIPEARLEVNPDGTVWFREEELLDRLRINASKDVMIMTPTDPGQAEMIVFVKAPAAIAPADLAGVWRLNAFHSPTDIRKTYWNPQTRQGRQTSINDSAREGEIFADAWLRAPHAVERGNIRVAQNGAVSGLLSGAMSTGAGGAVTFTSEDGPVGGFINASKTLIVFCESRPQESEQTIALLMKISDDPSIPGHALTVGPKIEPSNSQVRVHVVPDEDQVIQQSPTLANGGNWTAIEGSAGAQQVTLEADKPAAFIRTLKTGP